MAKRFVGFPPETLKFLLGIRKNNSKKWFESHRAEYEEHFVNVAKDFVTEVGGRLKKVAPDVVADPRINGSIFRINRDVRFSKDKRPYKDHLDFAFWEGKKKESPSSLFFRVSPDGVFIGAGMHQACPAHLKSFRKAVANAHSGKALIALAKKLRKTGYTLEGNHYKRYPRGFDADCVAAEFLLHDALYMVVELSPDVALQSNVLNVCLKHWKAALPLHRWLIEYV